MALPSLDRRVINRDDSISLLIAVPPVAGVATWLAVLIASAVSSHPIWPMQPRNLAEAVALRDAAAVVRLVEQGEDVNRPGHTGPGLVLEDGGPLTPLEAAAGARDEAITELLFDLGASPDPAAWNRAFCISDADRVREVLRAHRPAGALEECAGE